MVLELQCGEPKEQTDTPAAALEEGVSSAVVSESEKMDSTVASVTEIDLELGDVVATAFKKKRWYVAKVVRIRKNGQVKMSFMKPTRGDWKWGQTDEGYVEKSAVLMKLSPLLRIGQRYVLQNNEKEEAERLFQEYIQN